MKFNIYEQTSARFCEVNQISNKKANAIEQLLTEISSCSFVNLFLGTYSSPWNDIKLSCSRLDAMQVFSHVIILAKFFRFLQVLLQRIVGITGVRLPKTLEEVEYLIFLLEEVNHTISIYSTNLFNLELKEKIKILNPASLNSTSFERTILRLNYIFEKWLPKLNPNKNFNQVISEIQALRVEGEVLPQEIFIDLERAAWQLKHWQLQSSTTIPCKTPVQEILALKIVFDDLRVALDKIEPYLEPYSQRYCKGQALSQISLSQLSDLFNSLAQDQETFKGIVWLSGVEKIIEELGAKSILGELKQSKPEPSLWPRQFRYAWLASQLDQAQLQDPELATFKRESHEELIAEFRQLEQEHLHTTAARVRNAHAKRVTEIRNAYPEQDSLVQQQVRKKRKHLPLRQLFTEAPDVLTALRPCWMLKPLSVSHLLDSQHSYFDVVIFDEASQVLPEHAIPAILRAKRVVVAGDPNQLPPTNFFEAADDENEASSAASPKSLLDLMSTFLEPWLLSWHYRSRDEALIAFSNRHIYEDRLITFPNPRDQVFISHVLIPFIPNQNEHEEGSEPEVKRVVELIIEHATEHPDQTLGVITMGINHADSIKAALKAKCRDRLELNSFFDKERREYFFVKNIEKVQGDERDAIILSVGYKKDKSGNLPHRLGPLLQKGGKRRLNVAITRARQRMTLVSSFDLRILI